jgi:hypothetical protein
MVTRKPLPPSSPRANSDPAPLPPPYPISPTAPNASQSFRMQDVRDEFRSSHSEADSSSVWSGEGLDTVAKHDTGLGQDIPDSLRVGPPGSRSSQEMIRPSPQTTNPYLQKTNEQGGAMNDGRESSASAWGGFAERPPAPIFAPPPPPLPKGIVFQWIGQLGTVLIYIYRYPTSHGPILPTLRLRTE